MNIINYRYFIAAATELNLSHAAAKLFITQQTLSEHIANLEKYLGVKLFVRAPHLALTDEGTIFLAYAKEAVEQERLIRNRLNDLGSENYGSLVIGVGNMRGKALLPSLLPIFHRKHPNIHITIRQTMPNQVNELLQADKIDFFIGRKNNMQKNASFIPLKKEVQGIICSKTFLQRYFPVQYKNIIKAPQKGFDFSLLAQAPILAQAINNQYSADQIAINTFLAKKGITPHIVMEADDIGLLSLLAAAGIGLFITGMDIYLNIANTAKKVKEIIFIPFKNDALATEIVIAYKKNGYLSRAAKEFIAEAKTYFCSSPLNATKQ